jgi:SWI/SNF-related matrix-associated actin-dependent regulator of chromatin subfamily A member 5
MLLFICGQKGKTIQSISLIAHLKEQGYTGPSLVLCPLSVVYSWCAEIEKHAPTLRSYRWHSSDRNERETQQHHLLRNILDYDIVVTTYDMIKNPQVAQIIKCVFFNIVVLDEGHIIKDMSTQISQSVRKIHAQTKLILTGTPLQNNLVELYAILNFLYPAYFTKDDYFAKAFDISKNCIDSEMLLKANKVLSLFMLRRLKEQVEKLMPKKIETKV